MYVQQKQIFCLIWILQVKQVNKFNRVILMEVKQKEEMISDAEARTLNIYTPLLVSCKLKIRSRRCFLYFKL